ncbi:phenylalanine--tRNA ligase subunit alpha [Helicobacter cappadocius]|uniref:Phenylalanine--tRNA ligase alpha subunit n=1 Tax=Helicobacter cappadocius TaxID=3063998 RepID=A0AA90TEF9_9HELI|nr:MULTISPECIES: phenylalanine--tRNA ligase subunit alpha [unclassified Helicobacter]MDO7252683.1 phenylalanine--tRNA ligase subunit alpha [Helicobacter sp. faydin-H75]MDP2538550.1 phenylalanine--tRNA ligase subunit alpha [Helicobacter sp. faydin-H76]
MDTLLEKLKNAQNSQELEAIRIEALGKKGIITQKFSELKSLEGETKKELAKTLNDFKIKFESIHQEKKTQFQMLELKLALEQERIDVSLFTSNSHKIIGHPISYTKDRIIAYFTYLGYELCTGPLVEDDFHNFSALNLPEYHPARDMQDTFYFKDSMLLRTHTSPVQIRTMQSQTPPIKMICPGATFRRDYDLTHTPMFHQVEGLVVDKGDKASFANLKYTLEDFLKYMFGDVKVRFRSSFFPFTEPSAEVDISCVFCEGKGCRVCSQTGWLEVLGCGVVDEYVFEAVGYKNSSGYAFGMGIERLAMLTCGVSDLRSFFETDLRVLEQF